MKKLTLIFVTLLLPLGLMAQTSYKISENSTIKLAGTSSLHDWTMDTKALKGYAELLLEAGKLKDVNALTLTLPAESLKSGKSAMDKNAYSALKTDKHPVIQFKLGNISRLEQKGDQILITASGVLTIAGVSRQEKVEVQGKLDKEGVLQLTGKKNIKMTQYGVEPPSFMFGSVTTGDDLNIHINLMLSPSNNLLQ